MADVYISELLCFCVKAVKRFDRTTVTNILAKFYHDDELSAAKVELCKCLQGTSATPTTPPGIDGWSKLVNNKGAPITRRASDPAQRRLLEAEDVVAMLTMLDVGKVVLPTFVAADLDRVPGLQWCDGDAVATNVEKLSTAVHDILKRMTGIENRVNGTAVSNIHVDTDNNGHSSNQATCNNDVVRPTSSFTVADAVRQPSKSFASLAAAIAVSKPAFNFSKTVVRGRRQAENCSLKAVPRQLTCFVGRLHVDVTEGELNDFLIGQGMKGVICKKLVPKDGRTFRTSAFRVSCCMESADLFYDEALWPTGVELRDWVFYSKTTDGSA
jgi:hypothetical protein